MNLTEKDAAIAYALAWNRLDCSNFLGLLDDNARYASQWVFDELEGKEAISSYLIEKIKTVKESCCLVRAELGIIHSGLANRDCVFLVQGENEKSKAAVLFELENNKIKRYDLCIPDLFNVERTGIYPA